MSRSDQIEPDDLRLRPSVTQAGGTPSPQLDALNLEQAERWFIERTLARYEGNVGRAAEQLGLSRSALYRRLQKPDPGE
jgi:DNA-binding NtrC family response regulator